MSQAILFSTSDQTTFVIDIPTSIALAQGGGRIFSPQPVKVPYVTPEPRGAKRGIFISKLPPTQLLYEQRLETALRHARTTIAKFLITQWCLPRVHKSDTEIPDSNPADNASDCNSNLPVTLSSMQNDFRLFHAVQNVLVHNDHASPTQVVFGDAIFMLVPSHCTFMWASVKRGLTSMHELNAETVPGRCPVFDLIVMDPPWTNRSVRNARKYKTIDQQGSDAFEDALSFIAYLQQPNGHVAIWTTNKAAVRGRAFASMAQLGFSLVEEWVWLKVTAQGEAVTPLNGVWRKPYEVLTIFRKGSSIVAPVRRYIFAVPDLHSRKPNLKVLFETILNSGHVLELFARNLTSGWWCIGDEVLKFQDCRFWEQLPPQHMPVVS